MTKKKVLNIINLFGYIVDYDRWGDEGKEWIRLTHTKYVYPDFNKYDMLVIYKEFVDKDENYLQAELQNHLIKIGEYKIKLAINKLLNV